MSNSGRVQCLLISSHAAQIVFERFYDSFSEAEKAEIRAAFNDILSDLPTPPPEDSEHTGRYKNGRIFMIPSGELLFFALGTGEYNELALAEVVRAIIGTYKDMFKGSLTDTLLLQNYAATVLVVGEVLKEGLVEHIDKASIQRALLLKLPTVETADQKQKGLFGGLMG